MCGPWSSLGHATEQGCVVELCTVVRVHAMMLWDDTTKHMACMGQTSLQEVEIGNWLKSGFSGFAETSVLW